MTKPSSFWYKPFLIAVVASHGRATTRKVVNISEDKGKGTLMAEKKKLRIQDLARIREEAKTLTTIRESEGRAKVTVHMGTCGIAAGARDVMDALLDEIRKSNVQDVVVATSGCAGLCNREPMVTVGSKGQPPVKYVDLTPAKMRKIFAEHVLGGRLVPEYALAVGCETMY